MLLADFDPHVEAMAAQPFQLRWMEAGSPRNHVPDLLLLGVDGVVTMSDVKPPHKARDRDYQTLIRGTQRVLAQRGWLFEAWTGADPVLISNIEYLASSRRPETIHLALIPAALEVAPAPAVEVPGAARDRTRSLHQAGGPGHPGMAAPFFRGCRSEVPARPLTEGAQARPNRPDAVGPVSRPPSC